MKLERAFQLVEEYTNSATSEARSDAIVASLYRAGYIIRPLNTLIIKSDGSAEHLNVESKKWGLVDRQTRRPIDFPSQNNAGSGKDGA